MHTVQTVTRIQTLDVFQPHTEIAPLTVHEWCKTIDIYAFDENAAVINSTLIYDFSVTALFASVLHRWELPWDSDESVCLTLCLSVSLSPSSSFIVLLPFSCSASAKTEAVRIGWELNCSARARSQLSSPWDNEMTINEKAVAIRSFVHLRVERQYVEKDRKHCSRGRHWKVPSSCFHIKAAVKNSCDYHKMKV